MERELNKLFDMIKGQGPVRTCVKIPCRTGFIIDEHIRQGV